MSIRKYMMIVEAMSSPQRIAFLQLIQLCDYGDQNTQYTPEDIYQYTPAILKFARNTVLQKLQQGGGMPSELQKIIGAMYHLDQNFQQKFVSELQTKYANDPEKIDFLFQHV
jgi:hypothetical protein